MQSDSEHERREIPRGKNPDAAAVLDALGDETSREILHLTNRESATVEDLAEACEVSETTVYRRISRLGELGLIESTPWPDGPDSNEYYGTFDTLTLQLQEDQLQLRLDDRGGPSEAVRTLHEMIEIERAMFDRETNTVELRATATDELFDILLKYYQH